MKIAIFGGTFDPVHNGHKEICLSVLKEFDFDKIIIIPAGIPPHKVGFTNAKHRLELCRLGLDDVKCEISRYEIDKEGKSFTYSTLEYFKEMYGEKPYYIVGGDSMRDMSTWRFPERIAAAGEIIVADRAGIPGTEKAANDFQEQYKAEVHVLKSKISDISSTEIRILNSCGIDISGLTGRKVAEYIKANNICNEYKKYADVIKPLMKEERFLHSAYTAVTAYKLAERYGADKNKAIIAGLIHDCAKEVPESALREKYGIEIPEEVAAMHPKIRHSPLGALLANKLFGITDPEILDAIRYHTSGCENMPLLTKVIFIADYIDPTRGYDDTMPMYNLAFDDIDAAVEAKYAEINRKKTGI